MRLQERPRTHVCYSTGPEMGQARVLRCVRVCARAPSPLQRGLSGGQWEPVLTERDSSVRFLARTVRQRWSGLNCAPPPQIPMLNPWPPVHQTVMSFGDGVFTEITKLKRGHQGGPIPVGLGSF